MLLILHPAGGLLVPLTRLFLQVREDSPAVLFSCPSPRGIISPQSTVHIPLTLETQVPGKHTSPLYISIFGSQDPPVVRASF